MHQLLTGAPWLPSSTSSPCSYPTKIHPKHKNKDTPKQKVTPVRAHLRLGTCYILVLAELQCICGMGTQGDKSLLDAWAEMRRKLSSHSAQVQLYIMGGQHGERS